MTAGMRIGLAALAAALLGSAAPAAAFTLAETNAALGTASGLAASNGLGGARTLGVVQRRLGAIGRGRGGGSGWSGACGRRAHTPTKSWRRGGDTAKPTRAAGWERGGRPTARASRIAWARADAARCR